MVERVTGRDLQRRQHDDPLARGVRMTGNTANEGGSAIFFVSNDLTGHLAITDSVLHDPRSGQFWTDPYESIFYLGAGPILRPAR